VTETTSARILIVDDEPANVRLLERLLAAAGYRELASTTDPRRALDLYREFQPDLILLDLMMPHLDGLALLELFKTEIPGDAYVPILVLTADALLETRRKALDAGARDFLTKPFEQFEALLRIRNLLDTRRLYRQLEAQNRSLEETVRQRTERLLQSEKVATMGSLIAGVAHELNNPLAVLSGQAQLLLDLEHDPAVVAKRATRIKDAVGRCVRIVRNFLALARQHPPERKSTALTEVIHGAVELLAYELRCDDVEVTVDVAPDVPVLWADAHQLHQVLVNLIANAHQAMRRQATPRRIAVTARLGHEPERVRLEVRDTGPGMAPEVRARVFEAFFTTKPQGEGTGLGLSLCRGIVEEHGGTMTVESTPGAGATFIIELPVVTPPRPGASAPAASPSAPFAPQRVLVVDDEVGVAEALAEMLGRDGHTVDVANDGARALELLETGTYDVIVSDTRMPVLDGEAFYAELERRFPALCRRFIFLTGDVLNSDKRAFLARIGAPFLTKPCDLDEVRGMIRRVVGAAAEAR